MCARTHTYRHTQTNRDTHTHTDSSFIPHSFSLFLLAQVNAHPNAQTHRKTQSNKAGHSGPPPSGCLCQLPCQFAVPSYVNRSLWVTSVCLDEKEKQRPRLAQYSNPLPHHYRLSLFKSTYMNVCMQSTYITNVTLHACMYKPTICETAYTHIYTYMLAKGVMLPAWWWVQEVSEGKIMDWTTSPPQWMQLIESNVYVYVQSIAALPYKFLDVNVKLEEECFVTDLWKAVSCYWSN